MSTPRVIARLFAVLLIVLFVTVLPAVLLAYNATATALSPAFLDAALSDTRLYEGGWPKQLTTWPARCQGRRRRAAGNFPARRAGLAADPDRRRSAVERAGWVREIVREFRRWRWGSDSLLDDVVVPYGEMRDNLVNDPAQTALRVADRGPAACAADGSRGWSDDLLPRCRPAAAELDTFYADLSARWKQESQAVWQQLWLDDMRRHADNITLGELIRRDAARYTSWRDLRTTWRLVGWDDKLAQAFVVLTSSWAVVTLAIIARWRRATARGAALVGGPICLPGCSPSPGADRAGGG